MASAEGPPLYLDSSAIVKLIVAEDESSALIESVIGRRLVSSRLATAEVPRAVRRIVGERLAPSRLLEGLDDELDRFALVPVDEIVLDIAGRFVDPFLRTLDAIHLASALSLDDLRGFVTYDHRQAAAARRMGLAVEDPGRR